MSRRCLALCCVLIAPAVALSQEKTLKVTTPMSPPAWALLERRVIEIDRERELESFKGLEPRPLVPVLHLDRGLDPDEALGRGLLLDAGGLNQEYERCRAAIHDRHFGASEIDVRVVDPQSGESGHEVLDGSHFGAAGLERAAQSRVGYLERVGSDIDRRRQVDAPKYDARIRRGRTQGHRYLLAGMQANAGGADYGFESALLEHLRRCNNNRSRLKVQEFSTERTPTGPEFPVGRVLCTAAF